MENNFKDKIEKANKSFQFKDFNFKILEFNNIMFSYIFPGYYCERKNNNCSLSKFKEALFNILDFCDIGDKKKLWNNIKSELPHIQQLIFTDIEAAYNGDPALTNIHEVILSYPCFKAISSQRFAHLLYNLNIPIIPRAITELQHSLTGIDINPGAKIGESFFIDHGTGVIIGETVVIGNNVTLYQNVTLGAKSFSKKDNGSLVKGIKRHPNIENNVVVYAGATILGDITIGHNSIIGGNTWITKSVSPNSKVVIS